MSSFKFVPFSSLVDTSFWHHLADKKLNELKLDGRPISATATFRNDNAPGLPPLVTFDFSSFRERIPSINTQILEGNIFITNTIEEFKNIDKQTLINEAGLKIFNSVKNSEGLDIRKELSRFLLLTFVDLKKFHFYYWFGFPALSWPKITSSSLKPISETLNLEQQTILKGEIQQNPDILPALVVFNGSEISFKPLVQFNELKAGNQNTYVIFADPSKTGDLGWPLRNILTFLTFRYKLSSWNIISFRVVGRSIDSSLCGTITVESTFTEEVPSTVGWERNESGIMAPRKVDLSSMLDPEKLAQNAVSLNLKLMRWRLVPEIDLEKLSNSKCLLLGAGTLGCHVARSLLGWGVNNITLVDNSKVSYSNPVRQSLYEFGDCVNGGKLKAIAAAEALKRIYPKVNATGLNLSIPMPGHSITEQSLENTKKIVEQLECLIRDSDCIFLLMDTRESRWLPTLLAQVHKKLVINAALGFDTFLVQRHGLPGDSKDVGSASRDVIRGNHLGCYFCNDVVAPGNSTRDRTLDQQCTVTRPGVSMMAGAMAVELMVSVLQHPLEIDAPAIVKLSSQVEGTESCLGIVPHQIRGFLSQFQQVLPATAAFSMCSGCSFPVVEQYRKLGFEFLLKAFNDASFLEEVSGLKKLHEDSNVLDLAIIELSDDESS